MPSLEDTFHIKLHNFSPRHIYTLYFPTIFHLHDSFFDYFHIKMNKWNLWWISIIFLVMDYALWGMSGCAWEYWKDFSSVLKRNSLVSDGFFINFIRNWRKPDFNLFLYWILKWRFGQFQDLHQGAKAFFPFTSLS